jgi:hypothetical protein
MGTGDFTLECYYYHVGGGTALYPSIFSSTDWSVGGVGLRFNNTGYANKFAFFWNGVGDPWIASSATYSPYQWNHVALTRSGNNFTLWVNGQSAGTGTNSGSINFNYNGGGPRIGWGPWDSSNGYLKGIISDLRLIKGTALYTTSFTPPTAPLTNVGNTSLLCNFTNAGIFDQTAKNIIETQGDAKITTSVYKYGTGSIAFDGTGDRLVIPTNKNLDMTNNFTIEMWVYLTTLPAYSVLFDTSANGTAGSAMTELWVESNGNVVYYAQGSSILTTNTNNLITVNAWHHIAVVKNGTSQVLYVNGVSRASATSSTLPNSGYAWHIGDRPASAGSGQYPITGYIDDFRITKGYARYTSNFTPPTAAFKDK